MHASKLGPSPQKRPRLHRSKRSVKTSRPKTIKTRAEESPFEEPRTEEQNVNVEVVDEGVDDDVAFDVTMRSLGDQEESTDSTSDGFPDFVDAILGTGVGFYQLSRSVFVVQGWDRNLRTGTVG